MSDDRPQLSPMPDHAAQVGQALVDQLKPMLDRAFELILSRPGDPSRLENDALSVLSNVGAFVAVQLTARLMMLKGVGLESAVSIAEVDIGDRLRQHLADVARTRGPVL